MLTLLDRLVLVERRDAILLQRRHEIDRVAFLADMIGPEARMGLQQPIIARAADVVLLGGLPAVLHSIPHAGRVRRSARKHAEQRRRTDYSHILGHLIFSFADLPMRAIESEVPWGLDSNCSGAGSLSDLAGDAPSPPPNQQQRTPATAKSFHSNNFSIRGAAQPPRKLICAWGHAGSKTPGWGGRIRTSVCRNQNPVPYHLATPQCAGDGLVHA